MIDDNAVGQFISNVCPSLKDMTPGEQILQVNCQDTSHMTRFEATDLLHLQSSKKVMLVVTGNTEVISGSCDDICTCAISQCKIMGTYTKMN